MEHTYDAIDKAALGVSAALMLVGIVVLGIVEFLDGAPFGAAPITNDAGDVIATPLVDPALRTGLVIAGLLVLLIWGLYRMVTARIEDTQVGTPDPTAD